MNSPAHNPSLDPGVWSAVLTDPHTWLLSLVAIFCLVIAVLCTAAIVRLHAPPWRRAVVPGAGGTATIEFVLVFPILLFMSLLLAQTAQIMAGNIYVHYAAFAATRSAIVQIPFDDVSEPSNVVRQDGVSAKYAAIRNAAFFALVPVSGLFEDGYFAGGDFREGLERMYGDYGRTPPNWVERFASGRLRYASDSTDVYLTVTWIDEAGTVRFRDLADGEAYLYGPKDPITVRIEHHLHLAVPYVNAIFADGGAEAGDGPASSALVRAQYTLTNQGIADHLPGAPELLRLP